MIADETLARVRIDMGGRERSRANVYFLRVESMEGAVSRRIVRLE